MSYVIPLQKKTIVKTSTPKKNAENICDLKLPMEYLTKEKIIQKMQEMGESFEKSQISESSFCSCSCKEKALYNLTHQELEQKRYKLINLHRSMLNLKYLMNEQRKSEAKLLKLSLNSKYELSNPDLKQNSEMAAQIKYQNELVKSEIEHAIKSNEVSYNTDHSLPEEINLSMNSEESVYKIFIGRVGHLKGLNQAVFVILSSEAFRVIGVNSCPAIHHCISYEDIDMIIVGKSERWLSIVERNCADDSNPYLQVDFGDPATTPSLLKYLEIALRRRLINLCKAGGTHPKISSFGQPDRRQPNSIAHWMDPLLPTVFSCSTQETRCIEQCLMEHFQMQTQPRVLACWLVFWENLNGLWWKEDRQTNLCPKLEGFLMVSNSSQHTQWTPSYFHLMDGVLHQFADPHDRLPQFTLNVEEFYDCQRLPSSVRPHSFEVLRKKGGTPMYFAAPNENAASQWIESLLQLINLHQEEPQQELRRLQPCQVIQTNDGLVLSYQAGFTESLLRLRRNLRKQNGESSTGSGSIITHSSSIAIEQENEYKDKVCRSVALSSADKARNSSHDSLLIPSDCQDSSSCSPMPPLPDITKQQSKHEEVAQESAQMGLQLLAFCNLNQIAEIFITTQPSNGCFLEFEYSEANETSGAGGDWALFFESEKCLAHFIASVLTTREDLTQELMAHSRISRGRMHDYLIERSAASNRLWSPRVNQL